MDIVASMRAHINFVSTAERHAHELHSKPKYSTSKLAFNQIRHTFEKILADQEGRGLPLLSAEDYTPFLGKSLYLTNSPS
jgi:hypothetical protein